MPRIAGEDSRCRISRQDPGSARSEAVTHRDSGKLRLGIIGCGAIAEHAHLPAALSTSGVEVTAVSDTSESRLRYIQRLFGLHSIGFTDYRETLTRVDAVILALPNHLHTPVGYEFLLRGVHVLCEKPLALSSDDCDVLCRTSRASRSVLAVGYVKRFYRSTELAKELIESDFLGTLISFDEEFGTEGGWDPLSGYNLTRQTSGGGVLVVSGSHSIDRMVHLFRDLEVTGYADDNHGGVEANCVACFEVRHKESNLRGCLTLSRTHQLANRLRIVGERGVLEIGHDQKDSVTYLPASGGVRHEIHYSDSVSSKRGGDYFKVQLEDFVRAIQTGTEPRNNGEQGSIAVSISERCYAIAASLDEPWVNSAVERLKKAPENCGIE